MRCVPKNTLNCWFLLLQLQKRPLEEIDGREGNTPRHIRRPILDRKRGTLPSLCVKACHRSLVDMQAATQLYIAGTISFGSTVAGLGAAGGLGLIVLFRENHDTKHTLKVVAWLLGISITAGILIQSLSGK